MMVIGCKDKETEERHLRDNPLPDGWIRHYNDHTGRFYNDYSPEEWERINRPNPVSEALEKAVTEEINTAIIRSLMDVGHRTKP
jgi:hypothetical protein